MGTSLNTQLSIDYFFRNLVTDYLLQDSQAVWIHPKPLVVPKFHKANPKLSDSDITSRLKNENPMGHLQAAAFPKRKGSPTMPASPAICRNVDMRTKWKKGEDILLWWTSPGYQSLQAICPESTTPKPRYTCSFQSNLSPGFSGWRVVYRTLPLSCKN